jgi:hypothetical protein
MTDSKPNLKARALHEFARFATMFAYLWAMFLLFQIHQYVVLAQHHIPFTQFGVGFLNALVLGKVMLVADDLRLGEWRARRPLGSVDEVPDPKSDGSDEDEAEVAFGGALSCLDAAR